jgi:transcriptional regulator with GAF, ATPase, and Fis domain
VVFDCTAVPPNLIEAELFGHERGAFTGAVGARAGVFEQASGGTLLIDEIGDLELALQPKLLRVIDRGEIRRIGGQQTLKVDVRLLAATRRDLDREVQAGRFRDDLFHRLAVGRIELPPLRKREGDVELLAAHFFADLSRGTMPPPASFMARCRDYAWPGNVRELRNAVARTIALGEMAVPQTEASPAAPDIIGEVTASKLPWVVARQKVIEEFERRYVEAVLKEHGGNVWRAAEASGIARRYLHKLKARQQAK